MMDKLILYIPRQTARSSYIFELIFNQILGIKQLILTSDLHHFVQKNEAAKINYSTNYIDNIPFIYPYGLLEQVGILEFKPSFQNYQELAAAFFYSELELSPSQTKELILPFDPFSLAFYLVSRYEEYLEFVPDKFGRFPATESAAYQQGFLQQPLVNLWALELKKILEKNYPQLQFKLPFYQYTPTYDIDHAYAFLQKGAFRQTAAFGRNVLNADKETLLLQLKTWLRLQKDPYDVFAYLQSLDKTYNLKPIYFWLLGDYGTYDKNISPENKHFQNLISKNAAQFLTGIHPSFASQKHQNLVEKEIHRLDNISQQQTIRSRQHFLILTFPESYQRLVNLNIQEDYSMGYAAHLGFRASLATPFYWYNLKEEKATKLVVYPFQLMDVTFNTYLKLSPNQVLEQALPIIKNSQEVGGHLISIWHNSSLCEAWQWKGWRKVYEDLIALANSELSK